MCGRMKGSGGRDGGDGKEVEIYPLRPCLTDPSYTVLPSEIQFGPPLQALQKGQKLQSHTTYRIDCVSASAAVGYSLSGCGMQE